MMSKEKEFILIILFKQEIKMKTPSEDISDLRYTENYYV